MLVDFREEININDILPLKAGQNNVKPKPYYKEGDIGGYPTPQYRKKKWQIPKYRVEKRLNTDTAYFNHIHNRFRILMGASI